MPHAGTGSRRWNVSAAYIDKSCRELTSLRFLMLVSSLQLHTFPHLPALFSLLQLLCCPYPLHSHCSPCFLLPSPLLASVGSVM